MSQAEKRDTTIPSRRALLAGVPAVAAAALAAGTAVNALAIAAATPDAELLSLGRRFAELEKACDAFDEHIRPWEEAQARLTPQFFDDASLLAMTRSDDGNIALRAMAKQIEDELGPWPAPDPIFFEIDRIANRIMELPASTPAGLAVKAHAVAFACRQFWEKSSFDDADWDVKNVRSLVEAAVAMVGEKLRMVTA